MDTKTIGLQMKYHRQAAGLTQKELAEKIGTSWEMISRYETGKSSPLRKLTEISDALDISASTLFSPLHDEDGVTSYQRNAIPLINETFTSLEEAVKATKVFYVAPDWLPLTYRRPLAIDTNILKIDTAKITKNGVLYAINEKPTSSSDLVVTYDDKKVYVGPKSMAPSSRKFAGTVVAWEQRFR